MNNVMETSEIKQILSKIVELNAEEKIYNVDKDEDEDDEDGGYY